MSAPAQADTTTVLRAADLNTSESRYNGHVELRKDGVLLRTDSAVDDNDANGVPNDPPKYPGWSDKAAYYFAIDRLLSELDSVPTQDAFVRSGGSDALPGLQMVIDFNGNAEGGVGILVRETVYGGSDVWLTGGSPEFVKQAMIDNGLNGGGSGSEWHGPFLDVAGVFPDAVLLQGGNSLGSGIAGEVLISSMTYGDTTYRFTSDELPPVEPEPTVVNPKTHQTLTIDRCTTNRKKFAWVFTITLPYAAVDTEYRQDRVGFRFNVSGHGAVTRGTVSEGQTITKRFLVERKRNGYSTAGIWTTSETQDYRAFPNTYRIQKSRAFNQPAC